MRRNEEKSNPAETMVEERPPTTGRFIRLFLSITAWRGEEMRRRGENEEDEEDEEDE